MILLFLDSSLLRQSEALVSKANRYGASKASLLPSGKIGIKRLVNANITQPATDSVFSKLASSTLIIIITISIFNYCLCLVGLKNSDGVSLCRKCITDGRRRQTLAVFQDRWGKERKDAKFDHTHYQYQQVFFSNLTLYSFLFPPFFSEAVKLDLVVRAASFVGRTSEVFVCGRLPYFYSYDTTSGAVAKIAGAILFLQITEKYFMLPIIHLPCSIH